MHGSSTSTPRAGTWRTWSSPERPLRLGISTCLLGEKVRHDGGHKRDSFLVEDLGPFVEWVPVCPEVEIGMGIPRPSIRLVDHGEGERLVSSETGEDFTVRMASFSADRVAALAALELDGYVLKKSSPSCGLERIQVYGPKEMPLRASLGHFARELRDRLPRLPLEEEGRLCDPGLRDHFLTRVFVKSRWRHLVLGGLSRRKLIEFHTAHKLLVRVHDELGYARLGRVASSFETRSDADVYALYEGELLCALARKPSPKKHVNVLQHMLGYLREFLLPGEKQQMLAALDDYRAGIVPLVVPLELFRFQVEKHQVPYLLGQLYLDPHPRELKSRNRL